jgi:hypothetical protein
MTPKYHPERRRISQEQLRYIVRAVSIPTRCHPERSEGPRLRSSRPIGVSASTKPREVPRCARDDDVVAAEQTLTRNFRACLARNIWNSLLSHLIWRYSEPGRRVPIFHGRKTSTG